MSEVKVKHYVLEEEIGEGTYGKVYRTSHNGQVLAIKACKFESQKARNTFNREVRSLLYSRRSNQKNIVHPKESFLVGDTGYIVMDFMSHDLLQDIQKGDMIRNEAKSARIFFDVCLAVMECHSSGIAHMDLKPENILVSQDGHYFLGDLGSCCPVDKPRKKKEGSRGYAAPEVIAQETYIPRKADIWSLGILFHILLTGHFPDLCDHLRVALCDVQVLSPASLSLISSMLSYNPDDRPPLELIVKNHWVRKSAGVSKSSMHKLRNMLTSFALESNSY